MKRNVLLRPALSIIFGFIGVLVARSGTPPEIFEVVGDYFLLIAFLAFATLGFILPDVLVLAGKAGIAVLAKQIAENIPSTAGRAFRASPFRRRKFKKYVNPVVLDTSAVIDGRILDIVKLKFFFGTLLVSPSVVGELHSLSDSADERKRAKGRRGLDILAVLQKQKNSRVEMLKAEAGGGNVDNRLVFLAKRHKASLLTTDFNLSKVAKIKKVETLNLNELGQVLRVALGPGDALSITVSSPGKEKGQGVGYLEDGTMVVVENGAQIVGKKAQVVVQRIFATVAGKMIFAKKTD